MIGADFWRALPQARSDGWVAGRLEAHWAAQVPAALGATLAEPEPDYGHLSLTWDQARALLRSAPTPAGTRAGLDVAALEVVVLDPSGRESARLGLRGRTLDGALTALGDSLRAELDAAGVSALRRPEQELPAHAVGAGAPFGAAPGTVRAELALWYANAYAALEDVRRASPGAGPVRLWPHHFDIATLIAIDAGEDPDTARSIGVGLSPGDGSYVEPYWYANPWPPPEPAALPALDAPGGWHTDGWVGAVLTAEELTASGSEAEQVALLDAWARAALAAEYRLLGAPRGAG